MSLENAVNLPDEITPGNQGHRGDHQIIHQLLKEAKTYIDRMAKVAPEVVTLVVRPTPGAGEFASPKLANDSITDASANKLYTILIHPGTYTEINWTVKEYVTLEGKDRRTCILKGEMPASVNDTDMAANSTIWLKKTAGLKNLTITAKNMRYPVHSEETGLNVDAVHTVENCWIEHFGNAEVPAYRTANSQPAGSPWTAAIPWGYGSASGLVEKFTDCVFVAPKDVAAWFVHNNENFSKANVNTLERCRFINPSYGTPDTFKAAVVNIRGLGSGTRDKVNIINCEMTPTLIMESDAPWIPTTPELQYANHSDYDLVVSGSTQVGFWSNNRGKALRLRNASGTFTTNSITVSGTAVPVLFGEVLTQPGGGGIQSYVYGSLDISGILVGINENVTVNNTIGRRLGNRTSVPITLSATIQSTNATVNHTFNKDYTAMTNAAILSEINTSFGANVVAEEYLVSQGEVYPNFLDRQVTLMNTDTSGIIRFSACKIVDGTVRMMGTSDPVSMFAGIALENIPPNKTGRLLRSGMMNSSQMRNYGTTIVAGANIYLNDSSAGSFAQSGTRLVAVGQANGFAAFKGN